MKIFILFIDMFRPNLLNTWDEKNEISEIDRWMKKMGGIVYTNCWTPSPDTPRSLNAVWSGRYPKFNGCDTRIKYPKYNSYYPDKNFLRVFKNNGYDLNIFINYNPGVVGELPEDFDDENVWKDGRRIQSFLENLKLSDDSLTLVMFDDFHYALDDFNYTEEGRKLGNHLLISAIEMIEEKVGFDSFDSVLFFSDHGYKRDIDKNIGKQVLGQLGEDRSKVFLYLNGQGINDSLTKNNKLCSIMDIGPTLCDICNIEVPFDVDGYSLFKSDEYDYIVLNDHKFFGVSFDQTIEYWGIKTKNGLAVVDRELNWESDFNMTEDIKENFVNILNEKGDYFKENVLATKLLHYYERITKPNRTYFDGSPRKKYEIKESKKRMMAKTILKPARSFIIKLADILR